VRLLDRTFRRAPDRFFRRRIGDLIRAIRGRNPVTDVNT
jgi:hypothetical protein